MAESIFLDVHLILQWRPIQIRTFAYPNKQTHKVTCNAYWEQNFEELRIILLFVPVYIWYLFISPWYTMGYEGDSKLSWEMVTSMVINKWYQISGNKSKYIPRNFKCLAVFYSILIIEILKASHWFDHLRAIYPEVYPCHSDSDNEDQTYIHSMAECFKQ